MALITQCKQFPLEATVHFFSRECLKSPVKFEKERESVSRYSILNDRSYHHALCMTACTNCVLVSKAIIGIAGRGMFDYADGAGKTPLIWTIVRTQPLMFKTFIRLGAGVNTADGYGRTPLWYAAVANKIPFVKILLSLGAIASPQLNKKNTVLVDAQQDLENDVNEEVSLLKEYIPILPEVLRIVAHYYMDLDFYA
jgi:hypothetical protein